MGQLEWAISQTTKRTQIRGSKSSSVKQQEDKKEMGGLYFKIGKDACISCKLWDIGLWVLQISVEKIPTESIKWKANLKWPKIEIAVENFFIFWEIFNLGRPPMRIKPPEKSLCFSTSFECAFEPLMIIFRVPPSPYLLVRLRGLISFKCAFEPLIRIFRALSSPYLLLSAPSSLWALFLERFQALIFFQVRLQALSPFKCAFEPLTIQGSAFRNPTFLSSAPSSPHLFRARLWAPASFRARLWDLASCRARLWALASYQARLWALVSLRARLWALAFSQARLWALASFRARLWALNHLFKCAFEPSFSFFFTWVGHPSQWDPFLCICKKKKEEKKFSRFILHRAGRLEQFDHSRNPFRVLFFIRQVAWNN